MNVLGNMCDGQTDHIQQILQASFKFVNRQTDKQTCCNIPLTDRSKGIEKKETSDLGQMNFIVKTNNKCTAGRKQKQPQIPCQKKVRIRKHKHHNLSMTTNEYS